MARQFPAAFAIAAAVGLFASGPCAAQTPPAAAASADTPSIRVGVQVFADYTVQAEPKIRDADGNDVTLNAFQIGRSYLNVTGNITKNISFRVTPDVARETGVGSSLNGSYTFRLKYAFAQWGGKGTYARFGMQPTPWIEFFDSVYRYRFQGAGFEDREGFLSPSDVGASFHYALPGNYGDVQAAVFNGEAYSRPEVNDQKAVQIRGTLRPAPGAAVLRGLRFTGFWDHDAYVKSADRRRAIVAVTFEHPHLHAGFDYIATTDRTSATRTAIEGRGWSAFVTPRTSQGWEGLVRVDHLQPDKTVSAQAKQRVIAGVSYWFRQEGTVASALLFDVDNVTFDGFPVAQPTQRKFALHALVSF
jgi:Phosphate-selective porin O and P